MARIARFFQTQSGAAPHPTEVECGWQVVQTGERYLQLSTYGSPQRQSQPKVSQTLQLDAVRARELVGIIRVAFPDITG